MKRTMLSAAILGLLGFGASFSALAINYPVNLCAGEFEKDLTPDNAADNATSMVTMWGYSRGQSIADGAFSDTDGCEGPFTSPGPRINMPDATVGGRNFYTSLQINLSNTLPRSTSLVIPGTVKGMTPRTFVPAGETLPRVAAFDAEAVVPVGGVPGTQQYIWNDLDSGSYMYQSGTHAQVQVQMGLYGAVTNDHSMGLHAYPRRTQTDIPVEYDEDIVLFYTEIDRVIHDHVTDGDNATPNYDEGDMQSTIGYAPKYFAVDVDASSGITVDPATGNITVPNGVNPLIRFFNAGHRSHVPTVYSGGFDIHAEDGKRYPTARSQYSVHLPPLKTKDAVLNLNAGAGGGTFRLTDSAMAISSPEYAAGGPAVALAAGDEIANGNGNGMVVSIEVMPDSSSSGGSGAPSADAPVARDDRMTVTEGNVIDSILASALSNDTNASLANASILSYPSHGEVVSDGRSFRYEHNGGEEYRDSLIYEVSNAAGETSRASVVIDIMPINDPPRASDDTISATVGQLIEIRALNNDNDVDSTISITDVGVTGLGSLTANDQVIVFEATTEGSEDVAYTIADTAGATASAMLHLSVAAVTEVDSTYTSGGGDSGSTGSGGSGGTGGVAPTATDDGYTVGRYATLSTVGTPILGVMGNDSTGALVNTTLIEYPANGSIEMNEDGTFVYTQDGTAVANDDFVYEIYNEYGTAQARVTIDVNLSRR